MPDEINDVAMVGLSVDDDIHAPNGAHANRSDIVWLLAWNCSYIGTRTSSALTRRGHRTLAIGEAIIAGACRHLLRPIPGEQGCQDRVRGFSQQQALTARTDRVRANAKGESTMTTTAVTLSPEGACARRA